MNKFYGKIVKNKPNTSRLEIIRDMFEKCIEDEESSSMKKQSRVSKIDIVKNFDEIFEAIYYNNQIPDEFDGYDHDGISLTLPDEFEGVLLYRVKPILLNNNNNED